MKHFDGFCPRWILPESKIKAVDSNGNENVATQTLLLIDSTLENKVGVGLNNWPVVYLDDGEAIVQKASAKYIGVGKGDNFTLSMELGNFFGNVKAPKAYLFALLTESISNISVDFDH